ncbi:MAG: Gfo/Idh/MocA family oxidoreductase [Planctomycetes bacterium]|nr:Gfo/Idh/MocA family oxidoreductase [Planctomycetota bacterium]
MSITRRQFVKRSSAVAAVAVGLPMFVPSRAFGAGDTIRVGIIGLGGRGSHSHATAPGNQDGVDVVALCDPDRGRLNGAAGSIKRWFKRDADKYTDMRDLLNCKDIDAVSIATQVYWHGLGTIWACQAGKHVYVEKPLSHYIWEGRQMVAAARKYKRIVQCGTQHRSAAGVRAAIKWTRAGHLGQIKRINCFAVKPRKPIGKRKQPLEIPDSIDYDLWCGPAKKLPIYRDRLQYDCRYDWNTGGGETVDQGVHELDVARWWLGENALPRRTMSIGGRFMWDDAGDTANAHIMCYDFPAAPVIHEIYNVTARNFVDGLKLPKSIKGSRADRMLRHGPYGLIVTCEGGIILTLAYQAHETCIAFDRKGKQVKSFHGRGGANHFVNFIEAVRSGKRQHLRAEIAEGYLSTSTTHTANISHRAGKVAPVKQQQAAIAGIPGFGEAFERLQTTLKGHKIDPNSATLGPWLEIDRDKQCIKGNDKANQIVRGQYRKPFIVPDISE